jgi:hypothetical protein
MALTSITKDFVIKAGALTEGVAFVSSSTGQTGTLQVNGGAAIAKNLIVGTTATIWGAQTNQSSLTVNGLTTLQGLTATTSTLTTLQVTGPSLFQGQTLFTGAVNTFSGALFVTGTNIFTVGTGLSSFGGNVNIAGITNVTNTTTANSVGGTGALVVAGGAYVNDNLVVKSTAYNTATNTANAIYTAGAVYADKGLTVAGPVLFKDIVTFNGSATYVLSTNTFYTDNLLEIHTPPTGVYGQWTVDDGKDIGFRFHYYTGGADTNAALVLDNTTKYLDWYSSGAEATNGDFSTATYGIFRTGNIKLVGGVQNQANTSTGDLTVLGGVGVGGSIFVAGNVTATNFIGGLTGTATQANNLNGGVSGSLPYQSGANATTFLPIGTNGYILTVSGGLPTWAAVSSLSAGNATTASNIAGGLKDQIPYQSGPGLTVFNAGLTFNGTTFTATNIVASGTGNATGYNNGTGALQVKGGAAINNDLWVGGDINLQGNLYLKGVGLDQLTASTGTFDFLVLEGTGTSLTVFDGSTFGGLTTVTNTTAVSSTNTGALQVRGGVGIGGGLVVGGTVTATTANITGNETVGGNLTVTGYGTISGGATISALTVTNAASVGTSLTVTGFSSLNGGATASALTVTNAATVGTTLGVTGYTSLNGGATISAATVTNTLGVSGYTTLSGGATISAATVTNTLLVNGTTPSLGAANAGTIQTTGGVGIAKDLYVGTTATIGGNLAVTGNETITGSSTITGFFSANGGATLSAATVTNNLTVSGNETVTGYLTVNGGSTLSATTITNNATVGGTLGVTGRTTLGDAVVNNTITATNLVVTGSATLPGNISLSALTITNLTVTNNETVGNNLLVSNLFTATMAATFGSTINAAGIVSITNTTDSNATNNGALIVSGGVGIAKNLTVGTAVTVGSATTQTVVNSFYSNNTLLSSYTSGYIQTNATFNLDTFSTTAYRTAKYLIQIVDGTKVHVEEILVFHDGTNVYMTEYAIATSQGELGTFDAGLAANTITLTFTANYTPTQMTIKMSRQTITL